MERLTKKDRDFYDVYDEEYIDYDTYALIVDKLGKYEDLEEEIGCPLEVRCRLHWLSNIYDKDGNKWKINDIYEDKFEAERWDGDLISVKTYKYCDYKITWWLKPDRSE